MRTRSFKLDKLVRDGIVDSTESQGGSVEYEVLEGQRLAEALVNKLQEEIDELRSGEEPDLEKLADIREIIDAIAVEQGHRKIALDATQYDKHLRVGGFAAGHFIHTVTLPEDNEWTKYYANNPERFPEIMENS